MNKTFAALVLMISVNATAGEIKTTTEGVIQKAECSLTAKDNSVVGSVVGGTAGGVAGGMLGKALFGKGGGWIGGLAGGALGGAVGNEVGATETYLCKMIIKSGESLHLFETVVNAKPVVGKAVTVIELTDGTKSIM